MGSDTLKYLDFTVSVGKLYIDARVDYFDNPHTIKESSMHLHEHLLHEIYFIEKGSLVLQCDNQTLSLKQGDILIMPPHTSHRIVSYDEDLIRFNVQFMCESAKTKAPYSFFCPDRKIKEEIFSYITFIRRYMETPENKADVYRLNNAFSVLLSYILEDILPKGIFANISVKSSRLQQCILIDQFFFENYAKPITISDLAAALNYSETQARRILLEYTGMSFAENLRKHRIQAAKQYLTHSGFSIDEIAERCGYQSRMGFESIFKKSEGMSPYKYRIDNLKPT